ncbi:MAG: endolytic transglycosylase MltG [Actinomycetes bacterium]
MSEFGFRMDGEEPTRRRHVAGWIVALCSLVIIGSVGVWLLTRGVVSQGDYIGAGTGSVVVEVASGASLTEIADSLVGSDVIANGQSFIDAATASGRSIPPGRYTLHEQMDPGVAYLLMLDPSSRSSSRLVIKEGQRLKEIVAQASAITGIPVSEFRAALTRPEAIGLPAAAQGNPEGWLFPATYDVSSKTTATSLLRQMTARFGETSTAISLTKRAKALGLTPEEVVTIASILQVEVAPDDYGKAARVIYNRLKAGQKLGLDSTVNYALGTSNLNLSGSDLAVDSPYNTYLVKGLPPGPLDSPGEVALEAALSPTPGPWLYFITTDPKTQTTVFTETEEEFLRLKKLAAGA